MSISAPFRLSRRPKGEQRTRYSGRRYSNSTTLNTSLMNNSSLAVLVRFRSRMPFDEIVKTFEERIDQYRAIEGLRQKYYVHDEKTGEVGGLYIWDSKEAFDAFRESELRATIAEAYQVIGEPRVEVYRIAETLRELSSVEANV